MHPDRRRKTVFTVYELCWKEAQLFFFPFFPLLLVFRKCAVVCVGVLICCGTIRNSLPRHTAGTHAWERLAGSVEKASNSSQPHTEHVNVPRGKGSFYTHRLRISKEILSLVFKKVPCLVCECTSRHSKQLSSTTWWVEKRNKNPSLGFLVNRRGLSDSWTALVTTHVLFQAAKQDRLKLLQGTHNNPLTCITRKAAEGPCSVVQLRPTYRESLVVAFCGRV